MSAWKLPEEWVDTQLGNIVNYGKATKRVLADVNDDTWVLELEDIEKESSKLLSTIRASERPFKSTKNSFKKGDVLYGKLRPYLNKIIIAEEDGVCTTEIIPINAEPSCCNKYIFYWLKSSTFLGYVNDVSYGVNMPRLGTADGLKAPLRLAPLAEQKIIAEKLDTLLTQVDSTKARLEQIPQILKRFRQAVLGAAVSGILTNAWRKNEEYQYDSLELGTLAKFIDYRGKTPTKTDNGIPLITAKNIRQGYISQEPREYIAEADYEEWMTRGIPNVGDILITTEAPMGYIANINIEGKFALAQRAICLQFKDPINSFFASIYMQSSVFQQQLHENATGSTVKGIKASLLKKIKITFPPLSEQLEIVRRVEQLFAYADTIEKQVNSALTRVNSLTQSILAKAFRGELTAQWRAENPDLISGENSAAALLEKIKAERAASGGKKTSRKKA
ncbi:restriction endonuclease subunit S [Salmonella enterica]|nr:restriction endonuclease subunit S [Salmonella enterica]ECC3294839.1 restriction endonuclease subunit S [Salmonella enterica subsp. enterica]ECU7659410.1 restriction endonuclease subunit S [Salmonella enterica subsp. enterica serovar Bassadji]EDE9763232.1 restriction endonuclease subunit S [Salmonella enterica subsp. enterica serovar Bahati]EDR2888859.1 restriction endonuclease subunit S [Salmonella enterica subsp. enterica]